MIVLSHTDPNFVVTDSFVVNTTRGSVTLFEAEPISLLIDGNDNVVIGNDTSPGTVNLLIKHKTALRDVLSRVQPASFETVLEEDGELSLVAQLGKDNALDVMPIVESVFPSMLEVVSIRPYKE
jgi:hypothetical protein